MADGKWIDDVDARTPALDAARHVLKVRLRAVAERLPQAVFLSHEDVEHVHQLRVSTRRAGAALKIFSPLLPGKPYKRINQKLRAVRRAAGEARDWDVFTQEISERLKESPRSHRPGLDVLLGIAQGQRMVAQTHLHESTQEPPLELEPLIEATLDALCLPDDWSRDATLSDMAGPQLARLVSELEEAASGDLHDYEHLHQVRIIGKRLRYAMEVFAGCFPPRFRDVHYAEVERMQEMLGLANDSQVAAQRLQAIKSHLVKTQPDRWKRYRLGIERLLLFHQERLPQQRALFEAWWHDWRSGQAGALASLIDAAPHPLSATA